MINVAHDGDNRRPGLGIFGCDFITGCNDALLQLLFFIVSGFGIGAMAHLFNNQHCRVLIQHLVDGGHNPHSHHGLDHFSRFDSHAISQLGNRYGFRHVYIANNRLGRLGKTMLGFNVTGNFTTRTTLLTLAATPLSNTQFLASAGSLATTTTPCAGLATVVIRRRTGSK